MHQPGVCPRWAQPGLVSQRYWGTSFGCAALGPQSMALHTGVSYHCTLCSGAMSPPSATSQEPGRHQCEDTLGSAALGGTQVLSSPCLSTYESEQKSRWRLATQQQRAVHLPAQPLPSPQCPLSVSLPVLTAWGCTSSKVSFHREFQTVLKLIIIEMLIIKNIKRRRKEELQDIDSLAPDFRIFSKQTTDVTLLCP